MTLSLSKRDARRLAVSSQGFARKNPFGQGIAATLAAIQHLGYIQIDTISVIERAHNHTLWTRMPTYSASHLDDLQVKNRKIFEYWSHAAAYLPIEDYRFCLPRMHAIANGEKHWYVPDKKIMNQVYDRVKAEGPLMARDFKPPETHKPGPWWNWKPAKRALEQLFIEGKLMIVRRENFQKIYDLTERVLPPSINTTLPTHEDFCRHLIMRAIQAHGLVTDYEISYLRKGLGKSVAKQLALMQAEGAVVPLKIGKLQQIYYSTEDKLNTLQGLRISKQLHLLSPFDNCVIQRKRLQQIFDFDYQIECYVPPAKRIYGYFCLPILWGDSFVGRLDPKADRKTGTFYIRNLIFESNFKNFAGVVEPLAKKIKQLAEFNQCSQIIVEKSEPGHFKNNLSTQLKKL